MDSRLSFDNRSKTPETDFTEMMGRGDEGRLPRYDPGMRLWNSKGLMKMMKVNMVASTTTTTMMMIVFLGSADVLTVSFV